MLKIHDLYDIKGFGDHRAALGRGIDLIGGREGFMLHPNLGKRIELPARVQEGAEGVYMKDLAEGAVLDIETQHCHYRLVKRADTHARLSGHPTFCPEPVEVEIEGSIAKRPSLVATPGFIGRGLYLVYKHPGTDRIVTTSRIRDIRKLD